MFIKENIPKKNYKQFFSKDDLKNNLIVYHGTTKEFANKILKNGFDISLSGLKAEDKLPGISTSIDYDVASEHARWAAEKFDDTPAILSINISNLRIASGKLFFDNWDRLGNLKAAINFIKNSCEWDGMFLFDPEFDPKDDPSIDCHDCFDEMEVLLFEVPKSLQIKIVNS